MTADDGTLEGAHADAGGDVAGSGGSGGTRGHDGLTEAQREEFAWRFRDSRHRDPRDPYRHPVTTGERDYEWPAMEESK